MASSVIAKYPSKGSRKKDSPMTSKEKILNAVRSNKPQEERPLPDLGKLGISLGERDETFARMLKSVGGEALWLEGRSIDRVIRELCPEAKKIASHVTGCTLGTVEAKDPHALADLDLAIIPGLFAVAENGAVWVRDTQERHRAAAFIAETIILVVDKESIVDTMHEAYRRIDFTKAGFGVFISGPSKTADIEQSLVIGAHGAKRLYVVLT